MLIGQLAGRTGTSERLLRYYERTGLLPAGRQANGYREYDDSAVERVFRIRALLAAGLPTKLIKEVLPCADADGGVRPCPGVLDQLRSRLGELDARAEELARARETLARAIAGAERAG